MKETKTLVIKEVSNGSIKFVGEDGYFKLSDAVAKFVKKSNEEQRAEVTFENGVVTFVKTMGRVDVPNTDSNTDAKGNYWEERHGRDVQEDKRRGHRAAISQALEFTRLYCMQKSIDYDSDELMNLVLTFARRFHKEAETGEYTE